MCKILLSAGKESHANTYITKDLTILDHCYELHLDNESVLKFFFTGLHQISQKCKIDMSQEPAFKFNPKLLHNPESNNPVEQGF